jgi:NADPH:quinone reductase-like Zn-dependent oxidoreductase
MKAIVINDQFGLDNLQLVDRDIPVAGPGQVLIKMKAASLNFRDLLMVQGLYNPRQPLPLVPCSDGVGEVVELGEGVSTVKVGQRVATLFCQGWIDGGVRAELTSQTVGGPLEGALSEYMVLSQDGVIEVPEFLSDEEAACLPCAGLTAWSALNEQATTKAGDTILVQGTGGVSIFALQFAKALGARAIVTSSSDKKLERATEMGAWQGINYKENPKWGKSVAKLTNGRGVDLVVEVGGSTTLPESLKAVRAGGQISLIGVLTGTISDFNIIPVIMRGIRIQGILVGHKAGFEAMNRAVELHKIQPTVDRVFPLAESREALEYMASGQHFGKICIRIEK